jgi:hypothetical protein
MMGARRFPGRLDFMLALTPLHRRVIAHFVAVMEAKHGLFVRWSRTGRLNGVAGRASDQVKPQIPVVHQPLFRPPPASP